MKRFLPIVVIAFLAGIIAFAVTRKACQQECTDEIAWLKETFSLTPEQVTTIQKLHIAYQPVCAEHCRKISETQDNLNKLKQAGKEASAEYTAVVTQWNSLRDECTRSTRRHLESIAAVMSPAEGQRYLKLVGDKLSRYDHQQPHGLK